MISNETAPDAVILEEAEWRARADRHREKLRPWTEAVRSRHRNRRAHPVHDFLFSYYSFRPSRLEFWHPPLGFALRYSDPALAGPYRRNRRYRVTADSVALDPAAFTSRDRQSCAWITEFLRAVDGRPPRFGCAGLHEWAMVYRTPPEEIRHGAFPLRVSPEEIASAVSSNRISCTHYDAYRFFSESARPFNTVQPTRDGMVDFEQSGCLHANMDLYKWAYKLSPWIGSDLIADAFFLARDGRELDMRASPYDLRALGFDPIPIETLEGRREYETAQRALSAAAAPVRKSLIEGCENILALTPPDHGNDQ